MLRFIKKFFKKIYKHYRYKIYFPAIYKNHCKNPVIKNRVLFLEMRFSELSSAFEVLYRELEASGEYTLDTAFIHFNFSRGKQYTEYVKTALEKMAVAEYIITDEASLILSSIPLRKDTMAINLWHACGAFKKFGFSTATKIFGSDAKELAKYSNYKNLSLVTVSSPDIIWAYEEAMQLKPGIVKPLGVSRTDQFFDPAYVEAARERVYEAIPEARDKKVILYAPTFRGRVATAEAPDEIDFIKFKEVFGQEYLLLCKHHPFVKELPAIPAEAADFAKDVTGELNIQDLLCTADLCISDYSSLVFEYSLFEKPMIFYAYDYDDYDDWRGFYYNYEELTPGPIVKTQEALIAAIKEAFAQFDPAAVISFRDKFMGSCDGNATERIIEEMKKFHDRC